MAALWGASAVVLSLVAGVANGESYEFEALPLPESKALQALYRFYIYTGKDVPDDIKGQPFVEFSDLMAKVDPGNTAKAAQGYEGIELSIMPYREFWNLINPQKFCSTNEDVVAKRAKKANTLMVNKPAGVDPKEVGVYTYTVPTPGAVVSPQTRFNVSKTDVYALVISNCGDIGEGTITGEVTVQNVFGYLPGDQYYKMAFYGLLSITYIVLSVLWFMLAVHWWNGGERLHHLHYCITFVLFLGVIEAVFSWFFLFDWNRSSERPQILFLFNIAVSVSKPIFSYVLVLITGLGWGVTRPDLENSTMRKVQVIVFLYCVAHIMWEFLSFFRHGYDIAPKVLFAVFVPGLLVNLLLFCWMLGALRKISEDLEGESRSLFKKIRALMILGMLAAIPATALQLLELAGTLGEDLLPSRTAFKWHYQWFVFDAVGQIIYLIVFMSIMCQWAPQNKTEKYLYAEQINQDEDVDEPTRVGKNDMDDAPADAYAIGGPDEEEEPEDIEVVGDSKKVAPEKIGSTI